MALLDFTGTSRWIEAALAKYRDWEREFADYARDERRSIRDWRKQLPEFLADVVWIIACIGFTGAMIYFFGDHELFWRYVPDWPNWVWWSLLATSPLLFVIYFVVNHQVSLTIGAWSSEVIWRIFWLLSRPKAGVLGTIGLLLTVAANSPALFGLSAS